MPVGASGCTYVCACPGRVGQWSLCPLASLPRRHRHVLHKTVPKTLQFGGCPPHPMWDMEHRAQGVCEITKCCPSRVRSTLQVVFGGFTTRAVRSGCFLGGSGTQKCVYQRTKHGPIRFFQRQIPFSPAMVTLALGGGGGWHKAWASGCLPLAAPIGLSPLHIPTLCGPERVLVVSTEPPDDLSCLTTPGVGRPGDGAVTRVVEDAPGQRWGGGGG